MMKAKVVRADWDSESAVWVATSDDVPGLVTEAETIEALDAKLMVLVPELLKENEATLDGPVTVELVARRISLI